MRLKLWVCNWKLVVPSCVSFLFISFLHAPILFPHSSIPHYQAKHFMLPLKLSPFNVRDIESHHVIRPSLWLLLTHLMLHNLHVYYSFRVIQKPIWGLFTSMLPFRKTWVSCERVAGLAWILIRAYQEYVHLSGAVLSSDVRRNRSHRQITWYQIILTFPFFRQFPCKPRDEIRSIIVRDMFRTRMFFVILSYIGLIIA